MKYMRDGLDPQYEFLPLQDKILEIAVYIDELCREHNIDYCLMGGSALGAIRHGGFIPWDDDLDIFMTPSQYEKFREVFCQEGNHDKFYLQEWGACDGMVTISKLRMNGTTYIEEAFKNWDIHQGVYVDIFILHTCPNNIFLQIYQFMWAKYVITKGLAIRGYRGKGGLLGLIIKNMAKRPGYSFVRYGLKQIYKYRNRKTNYYCNFMGKALFKKGIYRYEYFAETKYLPFEKVELKVPKYLHEFLTERFGDYMIPPSNDEIKRGQHALLWDCERDFSDYLTNQRAFSDEKRLV